MGILGALVGLLVGATISSAWPQVFPVLAGAVLGWLVAEMLVLKGRLGAAAPDVQAIESPDVAAESVPPPRRTAPTVSPPSPSVSPPPRPATPRPPPGPAQAASISRPAPSITQAPFEPASTPLWQAAREFLMGGNTVVRLGLVILFFGVAFALKFAAEHSLFPIELRLAGAGLGALVLLVTGWRLRARRAGYALSLQGGGIGILYITVFVALRLYGLLPPAAALALLIAVGVLSAALALLQDSLALATIGAAGGFLAPVLASTGGGSHVMLFSYYALLNAGILAIAWFRAWRALNLVGFGFTFVIGVAWGARYYRPEFFVSTEPFLILFFLMYVAIAVLFALRQAPRLAGYVDGTLVFGVPLVGFSLQAALVSDHEYGLAWSALALGLFYVSLATLLWRRRAHGLRVLVEAFLALGVGFLTLAIPLALDGRWTAAAWAIEGVGVYWVGLRQERRLPRAAGVLLQFGAGVALLQDGVGSGPQPAIVNAYYLGSMIIALAGATVARLNQAGSQPLPAWERTLGPWLLAWAVLWWYGANLNEIEENLLRGWREPAALGLFAATSLGVELLGARLAWPLLRQVALLLVPGALWVLAHQLMTVAHPFARLGYLAWPAAAAVLYAVLWRRDRDDEVLLRRSAHALGGWLLTAMLSWEFGWAVNHWVGGGADWGVVAWGLVPGCALLLAVDGDRRLVWPMRRHAGMYQGLIAWPVAAVAWLWTLAANVVSSGQSSPLPYVPLLSPVDLAVALVLLVLLRWLQRRPADDEARPLIAGAVGAAAFLWLNAMLFRGTHHYADIPYRLGAMLDSQLVQAALSLLWSVLALALMTFAQRLRQRLLWVLGAVLLGAVVVKLFVIDLSGSGTVARIVSFLGVGGLLLVIGYLAPVPPRAETRGGRS